MPENHAKVKLLSYRMSASLSNTNMLSDYKYTIYNIYVDDLNIRLPAAWCSKAPAT